MHIIQDLNNIRPFGDGQLGLLEIGFYSFSNY